MVGRDENGRFKKGEYKGGPGRKKRSVEDKYYRILVSECSQDDWRAICAKAVSQAKHGDATARKFLADYLIGAPVQKMEHTGSEGGPLRLVVEYADNIRAPADDSIT